VEPPSRIVEQLLARVTCCVEDVSQAAAALRIGPAPLSLGDWAEVPTEDSYRVARTSRLRSDLASLRDLLAEEMRADGPSAADVSFMARSVRAAERDVDFWLIEMHAEAKRSLCGVSPSVLGWLVQFLRRGVIGTEVVSLSRSRLRPFDRRPTENRVGLCSAPELLRAEWLSAGDGAPPEGAVPDGFFAVVLVPGRLQQVVIVMTWDRGRWFWFEGQRMYGDDKVDLGEDWQAFRMSVERWRRDAEPNGFYE
jgi:hypothetical protein